MLSLIRLVARRLAAPAVEGPGDARRGSVRRGEGRGALKANILARFDRPTFFCSRVGYPPWKWMWLS